MAVRNEKSPSQKRWAFLYLAEAVAVELMFHFAS